MLHIMLIVLQFVRVFLTEHYSNKILYILYRGYSGIGLHVTYYVNCTAICACVSNRTLSNNKNGVFYNPWSNNILNILCIEDIGLHYVNCTAICNNIE
jgi:hypothetical protein